MAAELRHEVGISMLDSGWRGVAGGSEVRRRHGVVDETDGWGPHGGDKRERRHHCWGGGGLLGKAGRGGRGWART
jgi:hypothetical protein